MKKRALCIVSVLLLMFVMVSACADTDVPVIEPAPVVEVATPEPVPVVEFSVTLDLNYEGAEELPVLTVQEGVTVVVIPGQVREGFEFLHWSLYSDGLYEALLSHELIDRNMTLYAQWEMLIPDGYLLLDDGRLVTEGALRLIEYGYLMIANNVVLSMEPHYVFVTERGAELLAEGNVFMPLTTEPYSTEGIFVTEQAASLILFEGAPYFKDNPDDMYCTLGVTIVTREFRELIDNDLPWALWIGALNTEISLDIHRYSQWMAGVITDRFNRTPHRGFFWQPSSPAVEFPQEIFN